MGDGCSGPFASPWSDAFLLTHSLTYSLTQLFTQAPRNIYLSLYEPWPGPPGDWWAKKHTGIGEFGAVRGAGCSFMRGLGSSEQGLSESAWGVQASFAAEMTLN